MSPVERTTPAEKRIGLQLAARCLRAGDDDATSIALSHPQSPLSRLIITDGDDDPALVAQVKAHAVLRLRGDEVDGHHWRDDWVLEIVHGQQRWLLQPGDPPIQLRRAWRKPLTMRLLTRSCYLQSLDGETRIGLEDHAFSRFTRQSSEASGPSTSDLPPWSQPTLPELCPFWSIDLGACMFLQRVTLRLAPLPAGTRLRFRGYGHLGPHHAPPKGGHVHEEVLDAALSAQDSVRIDASLGWVARFFHIEVQSPHAQPIALHVLGIELPAATLFGQTLRETWRRAFLLFHDRAMVLARTPGGSYETERTYGEVEAEARALAGALARRLEPSTATQERICIALATRNRTEWLVTDVAAIERGYVVVPVSPDDAPARLHSIFAQTRPAAMLVDASDAARLLEIAQHACEKAPLLIVCGDSADCDAVTGERFDILTSEAPPDDTRAYDEEQLYALLFTSGSTGAPKGAMRSFAAFHALIASYMAPQPARHLSFQPLSHMSERAYMPVIFAHGGAVAFASPGRSLLEELAAFEPTMLGAVPRLFELLLADHKLRLSRALAEPDIDRQTQLIEIETQRSRMAFGSRLQILSVGSAPVSREVFAFLTETFHDIPVNEGYGMTEAGSIAINGRLCAGVEATLIPRSEHDLRDGVAWRGELLVRTAYLVHGYLGDSTNALDDEGYLRTGDLAERTDDGCVRVIGRLRNAIKLAHGEFVSAERIETALATAPLVDRVFIHAPAGASIISALVTPNHVSLASHLGVANGQHSTLPRANHAMLRSLQEHGRRMGLAEYELPRQVVLEESDDVLRSKGLLTPNGKIARTALASHFAAVPSARASQPTDDLVRAASSLLGREVCADEPLIDTLDSLGAAALLLALGRELGHSISLTDWFASRSLSDLARRLDRSHTVSSLTHVATRELARPLPDFGPQPHALGPPQRILLTGATGLLGAHLLEALLAHSSSLEVSCLVRAGSDQEARARLEALASQFSVSVDMRRVHVVSGDLSQPGLGLAPARHDMLAHEIDAIVHAGARVSWLAPMSTVLAANVEGTRSLLSLAAASRPKAFHFISTISTAPLGGDEHAQLSQEQATSSSPYVATKWLAEQLVRRAAGQGLKASIHRPGMIAPHSLRATGNADDYVHRYLRGSLALGRSIDLHDEVLDMIPVDFVAAAIASLVLDPLEVQDAAPLTTNLVNHEGSPSYAVMGSVMREAGFAVTPASYDEFRQALLSASPHTSAGTLRALLPYFPEQGFSLRMGPWKSNVTNLLLSSRGLHCPPITRELLTRVVHKLASDAAPRR